MNKNELLNTLKNKNYKFVEHLHAEVFTVEESKKLTINITGAHTKNLFLKNKKNNFYLLSCLNSTKVDLKLFSKKIGSGNLSFANSLHLQNLMKIKPGSVSPFGLLNDVKNEIFFYLDKKITKFHVVNFHPFINNSTISIDTKDFFDLMVANRKIINIYDFTTNENLKYE